MTNVDVLKSSVTETPLPLRRIETADVTAALAVYSVAFQFAAAVHTKHLFPLHKMEIPEISLLSLYAIFSTSKLS